MPSKFKIYLRYKTPVIVNSIIGFVVALTLCWNTVVQYSNRRRRLQQSFKLSNIYRYKFVSGGWCITQYLSLFSDVRTVSETKKSLSNLQWEDHKSKILANNEIIKEDLANKADLINRIEMLENKQTHQMV